MEPKTTNRYLAAACRISKSAAWGGVALAALAAVFYTHPKAVPTRDRILVSALFAVVSIGGFLFPRNEPPELPAHVARRFLQLSAVELSTTVIFPLLFLLLLDSPRNQSPVEALTPAPSLESRIICPHLFAFLGQIAAEAALTMGGSSRRWLLFPSTLLWNTYRALPLLTASRLIATSNLLPRRIGHATLITTPSSAEAIALFVHTASCLLWLYSTFYFCLFLWRPSYSLPQRKAKPQEKRN